jgi:carboxypeptidase C (cathepsin A)
VTTGHLRRARLLALSLVCSASLALADDPPKDEALSTTRHQVTIGGEAIAYVATAGRMTLRDYEGKPKARVFFVSYTREGTDDPAARPITFAFNGGPGSSAVWLHMGALGPRRVVMGAEGEALPPPYRLAENESSWLDLTDLVFVDPVSTGYSRPFEGEEARQFHGLEEDVSWVGEFVRLYLTRYRRWSSPKFLAGESYGTTRAAALSGHLQDALGMNLNGVVLVSTVLDFSTIRFDQGNDAPYWLFLPSYTAIAFHHRRLEPALQQDLQRTLREAETFARTDYLQALARGTDLPPAEADAIARRVARYTGLPVEFVKRANLRVSGGLFQKELLREQGKIVGRFDGRYTGDDASDVGANPQYDPSYAAIQGAYTGTFNDYVRRELGFESDQPYEILTGRVHPWSFPANNRYVNVSERLREALVKNPGLHVLVASGYHDLATPYFAADYTVSHLGLDPERRARVTQTYYEAGHMMYLRRADLERLKGDAAKFYRDALRR